MGSIFSEISISIIDSIAIKEMEGSFNRIEVEIHTNHSGKVDIFFLS